MIKIALSIFLILHGLVHLLYLGQSRRVFELQPGMIWPDGSWAFSRLLGSEPTRLLAGAALLIAAAGFVAGGVGLLVGQAWWRQVTAAAALISTVIYILFWDGALSDLDDKGALAVLINLALLAALYLSHWPFLDF